MQDFFETPPDGAIQTQTGKMKLQLIEWHPHKVQKDWVGQITNELFHQWVQDGKVGFTTYNAEEKTTTQFPKLSFVVLDLAIGCDGTEWSTDNKPVAKYYSNRIFDSRTQPLAIWMTGQPDKKPMITGIYKDIKPDLPKGVSYSKYLIAYCLELEKVVEIALNKQVENAIRKCLASIDNEKGKKTKWESVNVFNLASNDHLWGFSLNGYAKVDKESADYAGQGDLFFAPILKGGIVNPANPNAAELHAKCVELQSEYRAYINGKIERGAKYNGNGDSQENAERNAAIDLGGNERQYKQPDNSGFHGPASVAPRREPVFDTVPFPTAEPAVIVEDETDLPF